MKAVFQAVQAVAFWPCFLSWLASQTFPLVQPALGCCELGAHALSEMLYGVAVFGERVALTLASSG